MTACDRNPFSPQQLVCFRLTIFSSFHLLNVISFVRRVCHRKTTEAVARISELGGFSVLPCYPLSHPSADSTIVLLSVCFELVFSLVVHLFKSCGDPDLKSILLNLKHVVWSQLSPGGRKGFYSVWFLGCK